MFMVDLFSCIAYVLLLGWIVTSLALPMILLTEIIHAQREQREGRREMDDLLERRYL
jgi:hypothetical protein